MTKKMLTLGRLKEARRRLRDVAAGHHAEADAVRLTATSAHVDAVQVLSDELDGAFARLERATDVRTLFRFAEDVDAARAGVDHTRKLVVQAEAESERRRAALGVRARELKLTEELYQRSRDAVSKLEQKHEQTVSDDLGAARSVRRS